MKCMTWLQPSFTIAQPEHGHSRGSLKNPRFSHAATRLLNGRVLVAGGYNGEESMTSAEIYDANQGRWTRTGSLSVGRQEHMATLLQDGKVLVTGGYGDLVGPLTSTETYDPATGTWTTADSMNDPRWWATATTLLDGRVLVTGGVGISGNQTTCELFDPVHALGLTQGDFTLAAIRIRPLFSQTAECWWPGGQGTLNQSIGTAEVWDPVTGLWSVAGRMHQARARHTAALLPNGNVLIAGGLLNDRVLVSAEIFDPVTSA